MQVDSDGVWVEIGADFVNTSQYVRKAPHHPIDLAVAHQRPGDRRRARASPAASSASQFITAKPATTGAKAATLTASVAGVGVTGGAWR
jgi:hypothetical protein